MKSLPLATAPSRHTMPFALYSARLTEVHVIVDIRINDENRKGAVVLGAGNKRQAIL